MPRLAASALEENRAALERAALTCFLEHGYHGTSMRQIATTAGVSLGNFYIYFRDKLTVFTALLAAQSREFLYADHQLNEYFRDCMFPDDLPRLASAVRSNVERFADYFKLVYLDVVEFEGTHICKVFSDLDSKVESVIGKRLKSVGRLGKRKIDPTFAFVTIYLGFYHYFILTRLFGAKSVYGKRTDEVVVKNLVDLYKYGIGP